jgi:hypothetical protein
VTAWEATVEKKRGSDIRRCCSAPAQAAETMPPLSDTLPPNRTSSRPLARFQPFVSLLPLGREPGKRGLKRCALLSVRNRGIKRGHTKYRREEPVFFHRCPFSFYGKKQQREGQGHALRISGAANTGPGRFVVAFCRRMLFFCYGLTKKSPAARNKSESAITPHKPRRNRARSIEKQSNPEKRRQPWPCSMRGI